ncbi:glycoside hydrolase family 108 protein [Hufsiella ginkgonis]|uniref:Peptidoglycan-binding protein n=1 Tax=Hufsiella ginkgonis TaxID=2695274 RepID=A0A7K1XSW8_9SPHI|nr:glycosyl hydrolase 108 family protein [Hufsiella ginkgonis]MXV14091.1 hypothetical protein [Hufsiella ginkgonis]
MAQFIEAFQITMGNEGGYANNPADPGGETYKGISRNNWPTWPGWPAVDAAVASTGDVASAIDAALAGNASLQGEVQAFYKANFWDIMQLDSLNDQPTANQLFDIAVNMGPGLAPRLLQQAIDNLTPPPNPLITVDGEVGPLTLAAANSANPESLYNNLCSLRNERYRAIIAANPSMQQFANSWFSRITPYPAA